MSDDNPTPDQQQGDEESPNVKRMREQMEALKEQNDALTARVKLSAFKEAGLNPEQGIGKAVYRTYDGDVDPSAITEFAKTEYDWEPQKQAVSEAQQRMTALGEVGRVEETQNRMEQAQTAAAEGDWVKAAALKDAELLAITQKRQGYS